MVKCMVTGGAGFLGSHLCKRLLESDCHVIAVDNYKDAPAMQVAHEFEVIDMLDGAELDRIVTKHKPDFIVPEVESIRTEQFYDYEKDGYIVIPSAKAANFTMNRKAIRDLAAIDLGIKTAKYKYATSYQQLKEGVKFTGMPCVVKPLMSSSGKGQSVIKTEADIEKAWNYAMEGSRGDLMEVIVEAFIDFDYEITLLTVKHIADHDPTPINSTSFCEPIGHKQIGGDYVESWQPQPMSDKALERSKQIAFDITEALGGYGLFGVELFIKGDEVWFSEVSPRPHDTGLVTLISQDLSEFALHVRAILGLPIPNIVQHGPSASHVVKIKGSGNNILFSNLNKALKDNDTQLKLFGKPNIDGERRMGVAVARGKDIQDARDKAKKVVDNLNVSLT